MGRAPRRYRRKRPRRLLRRHSGPDFDRFASRRRPVRTTIRQDFVSSVEWCRSWNATTRTRIRTPLEMAPSPICRDGGHSATGTDVVSNPLTAPDGFLGPARPLLRYSAIAHSKLIKLATSDSLKCLAMLKIAIKILPEFLPVRVFTIRS